MIAATPSTSSRLPASLVRFASLCSRTPAVLLFNDCRGLSLSSLGGSLTDKGGGALRCKAVRSLLA